MTESIEEPQEEQLKCIHCKVHTVIFSEGNFPLCDDCYKLSLTPPPSKFSKRFEDFLEKGKILALKNKLESANHYGSVKSAE